MYATYGTWVGISCVTIKQDKTGKTLRFKARLVALGFKQDKDESYDETFLPVVNFSVDRFFFLTFGFKFKMEKHAGRRKISLFVRTYIRKKFYVSTSRLC